MSFMWVSIGSAAVSAAGGIYQAKQKKKADKAEVKFQKEQSEFDAQQAEFSAKGAAHNAYLSEFNAEQARVAGTVAAEDSRQNALRNQEQNRKYLSGLRANMLEKSQTIEGGYLDFLNEATGDLQLRVMDESVRSQREQASYANNVFAYTHEAAGHRMQGEAYTHQATTIRKQGVKASKQGMKAANTAGNINIGASVLDGFTSVYDTGYKKGAWGMNKSKQPVI